MGRYTEDMLIKDIMASHPDAARVFERNGLGCASCLAAGLESIAAAASVHDIAVSALLDELNALQVDGSGRE